MDDYLCMSQASYTLVKEARSRNYIIWQQYALQLLKPFHIGSNVVIF